MGLKDLEALGATPSPTFSAILSQALADRLDGVAVGRECGIAVTASGRVGYHPRTGSS